MELSQLGQVVYIVVGCQQDGHKSVLAVDGDWHGPEMKKSINTIKMAQDKGLCAYGEIYRGRVGGCDVPVLVKTVGRPQKRGKVA